MTITYNEYLPLYFGNEYQEVEEKLVNSFDYAYFKGVLKVEDLKVSKFYEKYWLPLRLPTNLILQIKNFWKAREG